ncbi:MAG: TonB-dependent receptor, partial [Phaeodactylibacter sp.]|nr:TonB-dependent receptor [Phaeodactylibacter sp.]
RFTTDVIERISFYEDNVSTTKPVNIGTNRATGLEFNAKYSPSKWLVLTGDFNYNQFDRQGTLEAVSFDFNASRWTSRMTAKLKFPADIDFEV